MTLAELILEQIEFEHWANNKTINAYLSAETPPERASELMSHLLQAKRLWLDRIKGTETVAKPWNVIPAGELLEFEQKNYEQWKEWHVSEYEVKADASIEIKSPRGNIVFQIRAVLIQLTHHSAYHRGQVIQLLKPILGTVPQTDYLVYAREKNG